MSIHFSLEPFSGIYKEENGIHRISLFCQSDPYDETIYYIKANSKENLKENLIDFFHLELFGLLEEVMKIFRTNEIPFISHPEGQTYKEAHVCRFHIHYNYETETLTISRDGIPLIKEMEGIEEERIASITWKYLLKQQEAFQKILIDYKESEEFLPNIKEI